MGFISFFFYKEYFYFIGFWLLSLICAIIDNFFEKKINDDETTNILEYNLVRLVCFNLGDLLGGFLVLYTYITSRSKKEEEVKPKKNKYTIQLIYNDLSIKKYKNRLIFLISIMHFIGIGIDLFFYLIFYNKKKLVIEQIEWLISIEIIARVIFCKLLLKTQFYKHHIFSLFISSIGFILMGIIGLIKLIKQGNANNNYYYILFTLISEVVISLEDVICSILLLDKFLLPHVLMFWRGLICLGLLLILIPILILTGKVDLVNYYDFLKKDYLKILLKILLIIYSFFKSFITMKIIYIFTPQHVAFLNVVFSLGVYIEYMIFPNGSLDLIPDIFDIIFLLLIIIGILIFTEIIIINKFGLNEETKKELLLKEKKDDNTELNSTIISNENEDEDEQRQNSSYVRDSNFNNNNESNEQNIEF